MSNELEQIKAQIQNHLVNSGNYDTISQYLKLKLYESGWLDEVKQIAAKEIDGQKKDEKLTFNQLYTSLQPKAEELVPESVKEDVIQKIKEYLDSVIQ